MFSSWIHYETKDKNENKIFEKKNCDRMYRDKKRSMLINNGLLTTV